MLTRKPGSDRGQYEGKISILLYSPGHQVEELYEDRFANESSGSRMSDYSVSSDPFRFDDQSPNFCDPRYGNTASQVRDILVEDTHSQKLGTPSESNVKGDSNRISHAHRSVSSGSFGSFDGNSFSIKSANSGSLIDYVLEPEHASGIQQVDTSTFPSLTHIPSSARETKIDLFSQQFMQSQNTLSASFIDLFADVCHQLSTIPGREHKPTAIPLSENEGWATFDLPHHSETPLKASHGLPPIVPLGEKDASEGNIDLFLSVHNNLDWFSVQNPASRAHSLLVADHWLMGLNEVKQSADSRNSQLWNASHNSIGNIPQTSSGILPQSSASQDLLHRPRTSVDSYVGFGTSEAMFNDGFLSPAVDDKAPAVAPVAGMDGSSFPPFAIPPMFLDMSSLQAALPLPDPQIPATFLGGLPEPWFPQNSLPSLVPPVPQGGLAYVGGRVPSAQLQNIPSQGPVASLGGNPFAY